MAEIKGILKVKAGNGKGFKIEGEDNWFNAPEKVMPYLAKIDIGTEIVVIYTQKGVKKEVEKVMPIEAEKTPDSPSAEGKCEVCGKELKNNKYPTCWECGKKKYEESKKKENKTEGKKGYKSSSSNTNRSDDVQEAIKRGNALNAAAAVASGEKFGDPDAASQYTLMLAEKFLNWLKGE